MARRSLAWGLILYGLAGIVLLVVTAAIGLDAAGRIERLASDADGTLAAAVRSTDAAAEAFVDVDTSLEEAELSAGTAANLSRDAAGTLRSLALAMELSLFGAQPLLPLSAEFETSAAQADELAETLDRVGGSLGDTRDDADTLGIELRTLSERIEALRGGSPDDGGDGAPPLRLFMGLLVAWLALPALAAIAAGLAMLRRPRVATDGPTDPPA